MLTEDYRVQLDAFEGPLDLLLFLIKRDEIDIHDIPVARITDQYLAFLEHIDRVDIDAAGEFLVTAATLLEIKSRMLAPRVEGVAAPHQGDGGAGEDPRVELVRQLLAYKAYRDAATALEQRAEEWRLRAPAAAVKGSEAGDEDASTVDADGDPLDAIDDLAPVDLMLEDLSLVDLVEAFRRVAETVNFERIGTHNVTYDDTPIELHAQDILDRISREGQIQLREGQSAAEGASREIEFTTIFTGRTRGEMVGLFLALLDLCRRRQVAFRHDDDGRIQVRARTEEEVKDDAQQVGRPDEVIG